MIHITETIDQLNQRLARGETTREALVAGALEKANHTLHDTPQAKSLTGVHPLLAPQNRTRTAPAAAAAAAAAPAHRERRNRRR